MLIIERGMPGTVGTTSKGRTCWWRPKGVWNRAARRRGRASACCFYLDIVTYQTPARSSRRTITRVEGDEEGDFRSGRGGETKEDGCSSGRDKGTSESAAGMQSVSRT